MAKEGPVRAAGGAIWRRGADGGLEIVLVHRPAYDDWSLPKGKAEPGETDEQTARREVEEETGLVCRLGSELPSTHYRDRFDRPKVVRYWAMTPEGGGLAGHHEVDQAEWAPVDEARRRISYQHDREVVDSLEEVVSSDIGGQQPDRVLEHEPQRDQAQRDPDQIGQPP